MIVAIGVAELAALVHRRGNLHARLDGRAGADEGIRVQHRLQRGRGDGYQRERPVALERLIGDVRYRINGRIDGCQPATGLLEEYKTTRANPDLAHAHHQSTHWAQITLYAALLAQELQHDREARLPDVWRLRLLYCHPDTLAVRSFERLWTGADLDAFLNETIHWFSAWMAAQREHQSQRDVVLHRLPFPFAEFRAHQRAMARRAYRAMIDGEHLLLEAPTGSGKTIGLLFPVLKALPASAHERLFFMTSRGTGAIAAADACRRLDPSTEYLRWVQIIAKEQACPVAGMPCDPDRCAYANGYHDRARDAVRELLAHYAMDASRVREVAEVHQVCPFELSLDAARWADVIIGDYNYILDPVVRLQRFADMRNLALLIDESHQLSARARTMLSLSLARTSVRAALRESLPVALERRVRAIDRQLLALKRNLPNGEHEVDRPDALMRAIARFTDTTADSETSLEPFPATRALAMDCYRWIRSEAWYDDARCIFVATVSGRDFDLQRVHLDPAPYLKKTLDGFGAHIRFSATVSPMPLYQQLHGAGKAPSERANGPFSPDQLAVLIVDDVPTYWHSRTRSLPNVVLLLQRVVAAQPGNYLVALPSFEYLRLLHEALGPWSSEVAVICQESQMCGQQRLEFIQRLQRSGSSTLGLVVMGGLFGESVDFVASAASTGTTGSSLSGIVCVGVGLPPPSLTRRAMAAYFDAAGEDGHEIAFRQPAMTKIVQMAGRLLRSPGDRGVLCLVDERFKDRRYQRFFPALWQPQIVGTAQVDAHLEKFWR